MKYRALSSRKGSAITPNSDTSLSKETAPRLKVIVDNRWLLIAVRLALGGLFITSSVGKLQHQARFTHAVLGYGLLPHGLAEFYAHALPWAELFIGCCLVLGIFLVFASALSIPLIVSLIVANIHSFFHPVGHVCDCLGKLVLLSHPVALVIDGLMLLAAVLLLFRRHKAESFGLGPLLTKHLGSGRGRSTSWYL